MLAAVLGSATAPAPAAAQGGPDIALPGVSVEGTIGVEIGAAALAVVPGGEPFRQVGTGYGAEAFVGFRFDGVDEVRIGGAWTRHDDEFYGGSLDIRGLVGEIHWAAMVAGVRVRIAPRIPWLDLAGAPPRELAGFAVGSTVAPRLRLGDRWMVEGALRFTMPTFPRPAASSDPDDMAYGRMWGLRLGLVRRLGGLMAQLGQWYDLGSSASQTLSVNSSDGDFTLKVTVTSGSEVAIQQMPVKNYVQGGCEPPNPC